MSNFPVVHEESHETPQQKRVRLAGELRFITQQFNSKVAELLEADLDVHVTHGSLEVENQACLIGNVEVSFQTKRKYY